MGRLHSGEDKGDCVKVYTTEELFALNLWLRNRRLPSTATTATIDLSERFCVGSDHNGIDWMYRKQPSGDNLKLFCLESWKRFTFPTGKQ